MRKIQKAVEWVVGIANDPSHGYDQASRWGPDYDCSSLVISAWESAGVPVKTNGATYTGNMKVVFLRSGFADVTAAVDRNTGAGLMAGDVLLHEANHTAMMISDTMLVQAGSNEFGGITGGQSGDQTGNEIRTMPYYNYPWDCVLRYEADTSSAETDEHPAQEEGEDGYTVQDGDTLWGIAERFLGAGYLFDELIRWNGLENSMIYPGDVLIVRDPEECESCKMQEDEIYTARYGDTLWSIAERFLGDGVRWREIAAENHITGSKVNEIYVGQKLKIPRV